MHYALFSYHLCNQISSHFGMGYCETARSFGSRMVDKRVGLKTRVEETFPLRNESHDDFRVAAPCSHSGQEVLKHFVIGDNDYCLIPQVVYESVTHHGHHAPRMEGDSKWTVMGHCQTRNRFRKADACRSNKESHKNR